GRRTDNGEATGSRRRSTFSASRTAAGRRERGGSRSYGRRRASGGRRSSGRSRSNSGLLVDRNVVSEHGIAEETTVYRVHERVRPDRQRAIYGTNPHGPKGRYRVHAISRLRRRIHDRRVEEDGTVFEVREALPGTFEERVPIENRQNLDVCED